MSVKYINLRFVIILVVLQNTAEYRFMRRIEAVGNTYYKILMALGACREGLLYTNQKIWGKVPMNRVLDIYYKSSTAGRTVSRVEIMLIINSTNTIAFSESGVGVNIVKPFPLCPKSSKMLWCLPWYTPRSERIKLQSCRNLIQHYLGDFLEHQLTLDQLSINICKGTGKVCDISLNCEALNELGRQQKWPIKVVESHMEVITVLIPWKNLFQNDSIFKINGLSMTVQPIARTEPVSSILKWTLLNWSKLNPTSYAFTSNNSEDKNQEPGTGQAAKLFAECLNSIQRRLKVKLENTKIRIEHVPKDIDRGFALECNIKNIDYYEAPSDLFLYSRDRERSKTCITNPRINKKIKFEGVTLYMQMHEESMTKDPNSMKIFNNDCPSDNLRPERQVPKLFDKHDYGILVKENSVIDIEEALICPETDKLIPIEKVNRNEPVLFATLNEQQGLTLSFADTNNAKEPKVKIQTIGPFIIVLSPKELESVIEIMKSLQNS